jgi:uncharacterized protein (UPF0305 family)
MQWQQQINQGDYHRALQSQGRPAFTPGDGSWMDFICRHMHHRERSPTNVESFVQQVAASSMTVEQHEVYWKCYVDLCRYYQKTITYCVYHTTFVKHSAFQLALGMAQRGDIEGLDIISHHFSLTPQWEWLDLFPCTLEVRTYLHLIPWNDSNVEERLILHIHQRFESTGQSTHALELIHTALQYLSSDASKLKQLRERYSNLSITELPVDTKTDANRKTQLFTAEKERVSSAARRIRQLENAVRSLKVTTRHAEEQLEEMRDGRDSLQQRFEKLQAQASADTTALEDLNDIRDSIQLYIEASSDGREPKNPLSFLRGLHTCLESIGTRSSPNDDGSKRKTLYVATLEARVREMEARLAQPNKLELVEEPAKEFSICSDDSIPDKSPEESPLYILQVQQTVDSLQQQLEQQAYEHDMERTGDKARIEYLIGMLDESTPSKANNGLVAVAIAEERRMRAVEELHRERDLYAEKMKHLLQAARLSNFQQSIIAL